MHNGRFPCIDSVTQMTIIIRTNCVLRDFFVRAEQWAATKDFMGTTLNRRNQAFPTWVRTEQWAATNRVMGTTLNRKKQPLTAI